MVRPAAAGGRDGGGERIPAPRPTAHWLIRAGAALVLATVVAVGAAAVGGDQTPVLATLGVAGVALLGLSMVLAVPPLTAAGVAGLALAWTIAILIEPTGLVVPAGLGLFLSAELAFVAVELGPRGVTDERAELQRGLYVGLVALVSLVLAGVAVGTARQWPGGDLAVEALGLAAVAGVTLLVLSLSRRA